MNLLSRKSLHVMIYGEKGRFKGVNIVPGWLWIVLTALRTWLIVRFPEVVDRQNLGMSWCSCYKNIVYKH